MSYVPRAYEKDFWRPRGAVEKERGSIASAILTGVTVALYLAMFAFVVFSVAHDLGFGDRTLTIL